MTSRVFLHVGLPKSGTTFLQAVMLENKPLLEEAGLLFPAQDGWKSQVRAVRDVREMPNITRQHRREVPGAWDALAAEMNAWTGNSVVSMEWLSRVEPHQLRRILDSLPSREIHVVFTIRDLGRVLPASYQESVINRRAWTWSEFLAETTDEELSGEDRKFWRLHDILALVDRWRIEIPVERIHVITVPQPGAPPEALWERFAGVLGVADVPVDTDEARRNEGLTLVATEVLRRVNIVSRETKVSPSDHSRIITHQLGKRGLSQLGSGERPVIPEELHPWVLTRVQGQVDGLTALGVDVVGDLEELRPDLSKHLQQARVLEADDLLDVAIQAIIMMTEQRVAAEELTAQAAAELEKERARLQRRYDKLRRRQANAARNLQQWESRPFRSALKTYVRRSSLLSRVVRRLRRAR